MQVVISITLLLYHLRYLGYRPSHSLQTFLFSYQRLILWEVAVEQLCKSISVSLLCLLYLSIALSSDHEHVHPLPKCTILSDIHMIIHHRSGKFCSNVSHDTALTFIVYIQISFCWISTKKIFLYQFMVTIIAQEINCSPHEISLFPGSPQLASFEKKKWERASIIGEPGY